jgi:hypothetical protein
MFCNQCGTPLQPDYNVCPRCGQAVARPTGAPVSARLEHHLRTLGVVWIVAGALWLLPSFGFMTLGHALPFVMHRSLFGNVLFPPLLFGLGAGLFLVAAAGICVGWGLMQHEPWARVAGIAVGILALVHPPFGTLLGIYTLWVLLSHDAGAYDRLARMR